jgi:protein-S-isoprenylcysteine O-methyltransferase Ste14
VITTGPYRYVRHPGYVSGIFGMVAIPLIIGSVYGLIPVGVMILLLIVRTSLEDRTLRNELEGYTEYAQRVKYRLLPGVW